jgi:hypothetical protein
MEDTADSKIASNLVYLRQPDIYRKLVERAFKGSPGMQKDMMKKLNGPLADRVPVVASALRHFRNRGEATEIPTGLMK